MREHEINKLNNFICGWYLEDTSICDKLIEYHKTAETHPGKTGGGVHKQFKDSEDCSLADQHLWATYCIENLQKVTELYKQKYEHANATAHWSITDVVNIQKYHPGGGYHTWHTERTSPDEPNVSRHLVFMTYLNDVTDAGETEFYHQKIKVKPEKGLTLIWPVDWTFMHRGISSLTQEKYIATGWYNFIKNAGKLEVRRQPSKLR
jgi:hypothetical protein